MKFSYNWLRELVEGGFDTAPKQLGLLITMKTAEHEGVEEAGAALSRVCAARVLSVEPMAGTHNRKAVVETGRYGVRTVVCGAANCRPGMISAYVPPGTRIQGREIEAAAIHGIVSDGMLASGVELGLNRDHEGILDFQAGPGDPIPGCAPDFIIEIDNKSITHRPDLWGHIGMAREVAAILGKRLRDPVRMELLPPPGAPVHIGIKDFSLCPRYSALVFDDVTVAPSPLWLQYRLESIGLNAINNIVDVTNFVMAEMAQPLHAFDQDTLQGDTVYVRRARAGETLLALNQETYELDPSMIVIADAAGAIAIGGVIGGFPTGITGRTKRIILESANFLGSSIRKTSAKLKLRTDASMRFEKSQDPHNTVRGLTRALELFQEVCPGIRLAGGLADAGRPPADPPEIELPLDWLKRKLGREVEPAQVRRILEALEFGVREQGPQAFTVSVPSWRATKDITIKDDLVEEVGRVLGYDSIAPVPPLVPAAVPPSSDEHLFHHELRAQAAAQGFTEVYNYSFVSVEMARELGMDPAAHLAVSNPVAAGQDLLRASLLPGVLKNIRENSRNFAAFRLFEIGSEIHKQPEGLPKETSHLAAAVYSREGDGSGGLFDLKRLAGCLLAGAWAAPARPRAYEHPARAYEVHWQGQVLGRLCELHPSLVEGRASVLDLDLELAYRLRPPRARYTPLRRFPSSAFDLSVVAGAREMAGDLQRQLAGYAGPDMESIEFVRQYSGPPLPEGKKSVSFRLTVGSDTHTLSADEIGAIRARIIARMQAAGYELRL